LATRRIVLSALRGGEQRVDGRKDPRAIRSKASNAPAAARLSSTRLLTPRELTRRAKSERSAKGRSLRAATMLSTAWRPTPRSAASA